MRIATFNTENLFSRAIVLTFKDNADGDKILNKIGELQGELNKQVYDKPKILSLYNSLKEYIEIAEDRENYLNASYLLLKEWLQMV